jgi:hypothetical protein
VRLGARPCSARARTATSPCSDWTSERVPLRELLEPSPSDGRYTRLSPPSYAHQALLAKASTKRSGALCRLSMACSTGDVQCFYDLQGETSLGEAIDNNTLTSERWHDLVSGQSRKSRTRR